jgi:hypothetical protein
MMMMRETCIDTETGTQIHESDVYEPFTQEIGKLYRSCVRSWGRCVGKVYIDRLDGKINSCGWVFIKRVKYENSKGTYLQETWVTLHEKQPETIVKEYLLFIG